ncbi:C6 transcription factor, putative [Talaromyces stipitatus ATCC 10500]|uniref:C6 transcription factor, putative n=1 Tax=Talaromyces stipitatus (strain ATCC 10500 / CBS 375.48 / QM 6759 / NRRL 1006) TaxID=441959 RepID=B8M1Q2_TALSN|nr:C6 transcription factor, putative [Talaromyces stipitatus ATCC 10500]EED22139.1 C6 transcription factor, putative [Talaromyces stipitatus ATCC 10500]
MRSSIACSRCRRSKIKCVNAGIDTTCRACEASHRECVYPTPAVGGGGAKRDIAATIDGDERNGADWDNPKRHRSRKVAGGASGAAGKDAGKNLVDVLDSSILSPKVWEALSKSFQTQFATILPFIDSTILKNQTGQYSASQSDAQSNHSDHHPHSPPPRTQLPPLILLGVLTLTARFHPQLVAYHSPASSGNPSNPSAASEFYASALRSRLAGPDGMGLMTADLVHVQALLMLALHEWGMCRGKSAWLYVGIAIRLAQAMGLSYELENDSLSSTNRGEANRYAALKVEADHFGIVRQKEQLEQSSDDVIVQETKRRTFWACFIMDRCLSSGKHRPRMVKVRDLDIQLPSDDAFAFGERVRTSKLSDSPDRRASSFDGPGAQIPSLRQSVPYGEDNLRNGSTDSKAWSPVSKRIDGDHDIDRWEVGAQESLLSRVIRVIRIWGSIAKWSCAGGRQNETYGPWQPESSFSKLRSKLAEFQENLPRKLQYSQRSTDGHSQNENSLSAYMVMHVVYFLSLIVLHRAYLPFLPLRCNEPVGPLDEPTFPREQYAVPDGFWRESTRELFRAARNMMDLVIACQERGVLVETPLVGFAIYNAAFMGIYAAHFSHMDVDGYLSPRQALSPTATGISIQPQLPTRKSLDILRDMRPRLRLAIGWFRTLNRLHSYFVKVKRDFKSRSRSGDSIHSPMGLRPVREGGPGGGLEEFKLLEKIFLEFGNIDDQIPDTNCLDDDGTGTITAVSDRGGETASNAVKSESGDSTMDGIVQQKRDSWVTVNSSKNLPPLPLTPAASDADLSRNEMDRRPSLPLPSRPMPSQSSSSSYAFPPIQQHPIVSTASPSLPSITSPTAFNSTGAGQANQQPSSTSHRLQPLNPWLPTHQQGPPPPPYSQNLPPINAATQNNHSPYPPMLPPPGSSAVPQQQPSTSTSLGYAPTPVSTANGSGMLDSILDYYYPAIWSSSLGGDDVLSFLSDGTLEQGHIITNSEVGSPSGWLNAIWNDFT